VVAARSGHADPSEWRVATLSGSFFCHPFAMYTVLAAAQVPEGFNADYYVAIVTILSVGLTAISVFSSFAGSFPLEAEDRWSRPFYSLVSAIYLYTPFISATGIVASIVALILREENAVLQWTVFALCLAILVFISSSATVYLLAVDKARWETRKKAFTE
jgi:hypothetical protein